jgi:biopolymer transport protein ExbD
MINSRRMKRMGRNRKKLPGLNLTSLMDVFTILVFFLLFNTGASEVMESPKEIKLPDSVVEAKPRANTVVIMISHDLVMVQGEAVVSTAELLRAKSDLIAPITARLDSLDRSIIGSSTQAVAASREVTILADKTIPFSVLKKVMSTCTDSGYGKISLAVIQKPLEG